VASSIDSSDRVYATIKHKILALDLTPGQPIRTQSLADELGVSRTPIRMALAKLESDGLVARTEGWGYQVRVFSISDVIDLYKVREVLETAAIEALQGKLDAALTSQLALILANAGNALAQGDIFQAREHSRTFYAQIARATRNAFLVTMLGSISDIIQAIGAQLARRQQGRPQKSYEENLELLHCFERNDIEGAKEAVRRHISNSREVLLNG
jgi:DNA-binding GntR family transcriptional regulator